MSPASTGLYLHIPFCRKACHYCDFHFSTGLKDLEAMTSAMIREMEIRLGKSHQEFDSIYFGGGTPSLLPELQLNRIMDTILRLGNIRSGAEITLEANPEDINPINLKHWKAAGINRLSIGLQSAHTDRLAWMNRSHGAIAGSAAVQLAQMEGLENISIDLIFGYPGQTRGELDADLDYFLSLQTPHISAYYLTIEPETVFGKRLKKGQLTPLADEAGSELFLQVQDQLQAAGYSGYEISNFARPGFEAVHNRNYWLQKAFTGIGPSAHGFDGTKTRYANTASNPAYIKSLAGGSLCASMEELSPSALANEMILTRLRMREGLPLSLIEEKFRMDLMVIRNSEIQEALSRGWIEKQDGSLILTREGKLMADYLAMQLFLEETDFRH